jgi:hypothetical protein
MDPLDNLVDRINRIGCLLILLVPLFGCLFLLFGVVSFPPTEWITRNYFDAVVAGDLNRALLFSYSQKYPDCRQFTEKSAVEDIKMFGGAQVRNVNIQVIFSTGSDERPQLGRVTFDYRKTGADHWQQGYTQVSTSFEDFTFRYTCGKAP